MILMLNVHYSRVSDMARLIISSLCLGAANRYRDHSATGVLDWSS